MSIHLEAVITASTGQVYEFLTNGEIFAAATDQPAQVSAHEGDSFSLFSRRVEGRQIELVPGERVVQAWRFGRAHPDAWEPGRVFDCPVHLAPRGRRDQARNRPRRDPTGMGGSHRERLSRLLRKPADHVLSDVDTGLAQCNSQPPPTRGADRAVQLMSTSISHATAARPSGLPQSPMSSDIEGSPTEREMK
jgi:hypothetical protein